MLAKYTSKIIINLEANVIIGYEPADQRAMTCSDFVNALKILLYFFTLIYTTIIWGKCLRGGGRISGDSRKYRPMTYQAIRLLPLSHYEF